VTTGSARTAPESAGPSWLLSRVAGRRATARGPASPAHLMLWTGLKPDTVQLFLIDLISRKSCKFLKFVETCMNVQKL
jgi:hypothetical protein